MKNLIIIGAGGCGREVLQCAEDINEKMIANEGSKKWNIKGFLDDNLNALEGKTCSISIIGSIDGYTIVSDDVFVCAIGDSRLRQAIIEKMKSKGAIFTNIIHPSAIIASSCKIGSEQIIYPFVLISDNAVIGDGCIINMYSSIAHDSILGDYCTISAHCDITGECTLGQRVFMGTTSNIVPGCKIGSDVYICAGATVMTKVRNGLKVLGNPAKIVKF